MSEPGFNALEKLRRELEHQWGQEGTPSRPPSSFILVFPEEPGAVWRHSRQKPQKARKSVSQRKFRNFLPTSFPPSASWFSSSSTLLPESAFFFFKWFYALSKINLLKRIMKISQKTFTVNGVWAHSMESAFKHFPPTKQGGCFWSECLDCASLVSGHCPPLTSMAVITTGCCRLFRDNSCRLHTNVTLST